MSTPGASAADLPPSPEVFPPESEGHIVWGKSFTVDPSLIEGAEDLTEPIVVHPEVVNLYDDQGNLLTLKLSHRLSQSIKDRNTGETIDRINLGSFGQNDPVRMWFASIYTGEILTQEFWDIMKAQAEAIRGEDAKPRLDEVLYNPFNVAFLANPDSLYSEGNWHGYIQWPDALPDEVLAEIGERVDNNQPLNYQYLKHLIKGNKIPGIRLQSWVEEVLTRASRERLYSDIHLFLLKRPDQDSLDEYYTLIDELEDINLGLKRLDAFLLNIDNENGLISNIPLVNLADLIIGRIHLNLELNDFARNPSEFPIAGDQVRERITREIYDHFHPKMTLGEFASQVYQLRLNNVDPNLR